VIVMDCETWPVHAGLRAPRLVCVTTSTDGILHRDGGARSFFEEALAREGEVFVGHNIAYDWGVICSEWPDLLPAVFRAYAEDRVLDTMIRAQLHAIRRGIFKKERYSLEALAINLCNIPPFKSPWRLRYCELDNVPLGDWPEEARQYCLNDVDATSRVFEALGPITAEPLHTRAAWALHLASCWGMRTDPEAVADLEDSLESKLGGLNEKLKKVGILRENGVKDTKFLKRLCTEAGSKATTDNGGVCTDKYVIGSIDAEWARAYSKREELNTLYSTFLPVVRRGVDFPINCDFPAMVESGRTASKNPNLQNLPRGGGVRECFIPRPGKVFISADYSSNELRSLAQVQLDWFGRSTLGDVLNAKKDPYLVMGAEILGTSYEDVYSRRQSPEIKRLRRIAKVIVLGLPGGLSKPSTVRNYARGYGVDIPESDVPALKKKWERAYPEMKAYHKRIKVQGSTAFVERAQFVRAGLSFTQHCNTHFQTLSAVGGKAALFEVSRRCYTVPDSSLYGSRIVVWVHDEIILETGNPDSGAELCQVMREQMDLFTPDVPSEVEPRVLTRWEK